MATTASTPPAVVHICSDAELRQALSTDLAPYDLVPSTAALVGVHFQMVERSRASPSFSTSASDKLSWQLAVIAVAIPSHATYVLQVGSLDKTLLHTVVVTLLEDTQKVKVLCDVRQAAAWLCAFGMKDVKLRKCVDLQLLYEDLVDSNVRMATMEKIVDYCGRLDIASLAASFDPLKLVPLLSTHSEWVSEVRVTTPTGPGTGAPRYEKTTEPESNDLFVSISAMAAYTSKSTEELRHEDYLKRKDGAPASKKDAASQDEVQRGSVTETTDAIGSLTVEVGLFAVGGGDAPPAQTPRRTLNSGCSSPSALKQTQSPPRNPATSFSFNAMTRSAAGGLNGAFGTPAAPPAAPPAITGSLFAKTGWLAATPQPQPSTDYSAFSFVPPSPSSAATPSHGFGTGVSAGLGFGAKLSTSPDMFGKRTTPSSFETAGAVFVPFSGQQVSNRVQDYYQ